MRHSLLLTALCLSLNTAAFAADEHDHRVQASHGGIVAEANHLEFELLAQSDVITLFVRDHGKPLATQGASARLTLLSGGEKSEISLLPAGENRLEARGNFALAKDSKAVVLLTMPGQKLANLRFSLH